jgi:hypothetical protein
LLVYNLLTETKNILMKKLSKISAFLLISFISFAIVNSSEAQITNPLHVVKDKSTDRANDKVDNGVDKGLNGVENVFKKKDKTKDTTKTVAATKKNDTPKAKKVESETDTDIPTSKQINENRYALIIGNEDYSKFQPDLKSEANVDFAENDARIFSQYVIKTLGTPESNVTLLINATAAQMKQGLAKLNLIAKNSNGKAEVLLYYAGHGLPDENTKEPYMIPVDVNASTIDQAIKLDDAYNKLTEFPVMKATVFLDACFSGGARNQALQSSRAIKINPKQVSIPSKLVVFTSCSGDQSSLPYKDKGHGIYTYFLCKKLQDTKGDITYKELGDYLKDKVSLESVVVNSKEQNPQTIVNPELQDTWESWKLK